MAWEITSKCNLKCVHRRSSSGIHSAVGDAPLEKAKKFVDELTEFAKPVVVLTGGEPLMREDVRHRRIRHRKRTSYGYGHQRNSC